MGKRVHVISAAVNKIVWYPVYVPKQHDSKMVVGLDRLISNNVLAKKLPDLLADSSEDWPWKKKGMTSLWGQ